MPIRVATCNADKSLSRAVARRVVAEVTSQADVVCWQEVGPHHMAALKALPGWRTYHPGSPWGLAISWRTDRLSLRRRGARRRVVPGIRDVDPVRGCIDVVLTDRASGDVYAVMSAHATHQAWTSHPERRGRWRLQAFRLRMRTRRLARRWGAVVGGGDVNRDRWAPVGTTGHWAARPTYKGRRYDVLWTRGRIAVSGRPQRITTPSDHDALVATVRRTT